MAPLASVLESADPRRRAFAALRAELSGAGEPLARASLAGVLPSGIAELDALLGGGFPRGTVVALEGRLGRWSIVARLLAETTRRAPVAVLDDGALYPPGLAEAGVRLERLLVVPVRDPRATARAADILARARTCRVVVMPGLPLPGAAWVRLAGLAYRSGTLIVAVVEAAPAALAAAATVRLQCALECVAVHGPGGVWGVFGGLTVEMRLCKHRRRAPGARARMYGGTALGDVPVRERAVTRPSERGVEVRRAVR